MPTNPNNMASLIQLLRMKPGLGETPSNDFNWLIPESIEKQRESGVLANMDARTNASMAEDLEEANAVRGARNMGFTGSNPLREQSDYGAMQKLQQILLPKQMELQIAQQENEAQNARATQAQTAAMEREKFKQGAMTDRSAMVRKAIEDYARLTGKVPEPGWLESLFGGSEEDEAAAPMSAAPASGGVSIRSVRQVR